MAAIFRIYAQKSTGYFISQINVAVIGLICDGFLLGGLIMPKANQDINPLLFAVFVRQLGVWPLWIGGAVLLIYLNWLLVVFAKSRLAP